MSDSPEKKWYGRTWVWGCLAGVLVVALISFAIYNYLQLDSPRRWWPETAGDWSAWGAWIGAAGTIGAVLYAARQFHQSKVVSAEERDARLRELDQIDEERTLAVSGVVVHLDANDFMVLERFWDENDREWFEQPVSIGEARRLTALVVNTTNSPCTAGRIFLPEPYRQPAAFQLERGRAKRFEFSEGWTLDEATTSHLESGSEHKGWYLLGDLPAGGAVRISWDYPTNQMVVPWKKSHEAYPELGRRGHGAHILFQDSMSRIWRRYPAASRAERVLLEEVP